MSVNIPGHEGIGTVVEPVTSPLYHARVGIRWIVSTCLDCEICAVNETSCPKQKNSGRNVDGTLRQYVSVDERFAVRIPEEIGSEVAAVMMCGKCCVKLLPRLRRRLVSGKHLLLVMYWADGTSGNITILRSEEIERQSR